MSVDLKALRSKLDEINERTAGMGGGPRWKPKDGTNIVRLGPPTKGSKAFYFEIPFHFNLGTRKYACLKAKGEDCPICEAVEALYGSGVEEDRNLARELTGRTKYLMNVRDEESGDPQWKIYEMGTLLFQSLLGFMTDPDYGDVTDPKKGRKLKITRQGTGLDTRYQLIPAGKTTVLAGGKKALDGLHDLEEAVQFESYDKLKSILEGEVLDEESDDFEEEFEDEEDDEVEDEEFEEEEDDEDEEDWDDEEDEDEEDEDEEDEDEEDEDEEDWDDEEDEEFEEDDEEDWDEDEEDEDEDEEDEDEEDEDEEDEEDVDLDDLDLDDLDLDDLDLDDEPKKSSKKKADKKKADKKKTTKKKAAKKKAKKKKK